MPKTAMDYSNTIIYKLVCRDITITECYVGHTTNFTKRKNCHKSCLTNKTNKYHNLYVYQFIREHGGWDNWVMVEIELFECNNKNEACARERYWIETLQAKLNKVIPTRTYEEYCLENKEKIFEYQKEYREENKENIKETMKKYYETNKEQILKYKKEYVEENKENIKETMKKYYEINKEKLKEFNKEYYKANKEKISQKNSDKFECECGSIICYSAKSKHLKTKKHQKIISKIK